MASILREKHDGALARRTDVKLWLRLLSCSTIIEKRLRRRFADRFGITLPRFDVLATVERHPDGVTMGELSQSLLVSNGNVTALVRQLEQDGLVSTSPSPGDRRVLIVALTDMGGALFSELAAAHHEWIEAMFGKMSADEKKALFGLLARLKDSIGAAVDRKGEK